MPSSCARAEAPSHPPLQHHLAYLRSRCLSSGPMVLKGFEGFVQTNGRNAPLSNGLHWFCWGASTLEGLMDAFDGVAVRQPALQNNGNQVFQHVCFAKLTKQHHIRCRATGVHVNVPPHRSTMWSNRTTHGHDGPSNSIPPTAVTCPRKNPPQSMTVEYQLVTLQHISWLEASFSCWSPQGNIQEGGVPWS